MENQYNEEEIYLLPDPEALAEEIAL